MVLKIKIEKSWEKQPTPEAKGADVEKVEKKEYKPEILLPQTLEFKRNHLDVSEFDPEWELREIREFILKLPTEEQSSQRRVLIANFKRKLAAMRENMMDAQIEVEQFIRSNPDVSYEEANKSLENILVKNFVSLGEQLRRGLSSYIEGRDDVKSVIERYRKASDEDQERRNWEAELFKDLFGKYPVGMVKMQIVLGGLYLYLYDIEDYTHAFLDHEAKDAEEMMAASRSGGAQLNKEFDLVPELSRKVIIENSFLVDASSKVKLHEEEHAIHQNLYPGWLFSTEASRKSINQFLGFRGRKIDEQEFLGWARRYAKGIISEFGGRAKTEILAYLKEGRHINDIRRVLLDEDGLYNYLENDNRVEVFANFITDSINNHLINIQEDSKKYKGHDLSPILKDIITEAWNKDYKNNLEKALDAVSHLLQQYGKNSEGKMKVIRLLIQEPLDKWPRLVKILS